MSHDTPFVRDLDRLFFVLSHNRRRKAIGNPPTCINWQPIETAPRTNQSILVWCPAIGCTFTVFWDYFAENWAIFGAGWVGLDGQPILWVPVATSL